MRYSIVALTAALLVGFAHSAQAGIYTDDMAKCLVSKSSQADKDTLMRWMFVAMSANPAVKPLSNVNAAQRESYTRAAVALMERLVFKDCHTESLNAVKYEGAGAMSGSFQVLGQVAARGLMSDPAAIEALGELNKYSDQSKWEALGKEAGLR
jgi:hypothetical protein